jgi:hypothetical protein
MQQDRSYQLAQSTLMRVLLKPRWLRLVFLWLFNTLLEDYLPKYKPIYITATRGRCPLSSGTE